MIAPMTYQRWADAGPEDSGGAGFGIHYSPFLAGALLGAVAGFWLAIFTHRSERACTAVCALLGGILMSALYS